MPVAISAVLEAPVQQVWAVIGDFANLKRWHPLVVSCETQGTGEGAIRTVHFAEWWARERLDRWDPKNFALQYFVLDSSRPQNIGVQGSMSLTAETPTTTRINWTSGLQDHLPHAQEVNTMLSAYYPVRIGHLRSALGLPPA